jgi:hypothetical protein
VGGDAHAQAIAAQAPHLGQRQVLLAHVHEVGAHQQGHVHAIVHAEWDPHRPAKGQDPQRRLLQLGRAQALGAELEAAGDRRQQLAGPRLERAAR